MHIYFIGIGGVAMGPLARLARDAGYNVSGSDMVASRYTDSVKAEGIPVQIGNTEETIATIHSQRPIDWVVYTSAVPADSQELAFARSRGIRTSKRDVLINHILKEKGLRMIGVTGTHGKTNSTGMLIWLCMQMKSPISYNVGTNISFGPNGLYHRDSKYFVYEADEFDRNFLKFNTEFAIIPSVDYDHPETYETREDYIAAFREFVGNSKMIITWQHVGDYLGLQQGENVQLLPDDMDVSDFKLPGEHTRRNAALVTALMEQAFGKKRKKIIKKLNDFPGTERRMEKLADNLYTDYAHHPTEIRATLSAAKELNERVVAVYQPHQNVRQRELIHEYKDAFSEAEKVLWLPTFLSRESADNIISADELIRALDDPTLAEKADLNDDLYDAINKARSSGALVLLMSAGDLDSWARNRYRNQNP